MENNQNNKPNASFQIDSYKFWDIVRLWGRDKLVHEVVIARELANGVIKTGLRFHSKNPKWVNPSEESLTYPYIGYSAISEESPIIIKANALAHLINVAELKVDPSEHILEEMTLQKIDFINWLIRTGQPFPLFWK